MKAAVLYGPWDLRVVEVKDPHPGAGEVLVKVAGCGVCHSDLHQLKGEIPAILPKVPGHEVSGTVFEAGAGVDDALVGTDIVAPFIMPCGDCAECRAGRDEYCENFWTLNRGKGTLYDGTTRLFDTSGAPLWMDAMSGMAEFAVMPAASVFAAPTNLPLPDAAVLGCAMFTAYGAVRNAGLREGETVAVVAVGGVGGSIVQIARALGAGEVIAIDVTADKLADAKALGATATIDGSAEDVVARVQELTGGRGVDVAFEALGRPGTLHQAIELTGRGGRVVAVGVTASGATMPLDVNRLVRNQTRLIGSYGARARRDVPELVQLVEDGALRPAVTRHVRLDEALDTFRALDAGAIVGRAVVDFTSGEYRDER